jgi:hypothetical protein
MSSKGDASVPPIPFDRLSRTLGALMGRRALLRASTLAALLGADGKATLARHKHHKHKKKRCTPRRCGDSVCGSPHCKGSCGTCAGDAVCSGGQCCDVCPRGCRFTTVQAAINAAADDAVIALCPGTYLEQITIGKSLTLVGQGKDASKTILRNATGPIVLIEAGGSARLQNLTVTGVTSGATGGILNQGSLSLIDSIVRDNVADSGTGGGIRNESAASLLGSTVVEGNTAQKGGGIDNDGACTLFDHSRVTGNTATDPAPSGGGVFNRGAFSALDESTVTGNTPDDCVRASDGSSCA